jgi:hypothetical protein
MQIVPIFMRATLQCSLRKGKVAADFLMLYEAAQCPELLALGLSSKYSCKSSP